ITSVKLSDGDLRTVGTKELHGKSSWVTTMNVLQEGKKFYVISTSSDWRSGENTLTVQDISSAKGEITTFLRAKTRGRLSETSQTFIHKEHLFAVSNYQEQNKPMRVSIEAFPMRPSSEVLS